MTSDDAADTVEVTLVRHAQTTSNRDGIWQGQGNSQLSPLGEDQARALGERLVGTRFDRIVCSDLLRTRTTLERAMPTAAPDLDPAWREIDVGRWEGLSRAQVAERYGDEIAALKRGEPVAVGGGESWRDLEARVDQALGALVDRLDAGERALVMTHGGVIHALSSGLFGLRGRRPPRPIGRIANTAVTVLRFRKSPPGRETTVDRYNDAGHLAAPPEAIADHLARGERVVRLVADAAEGAEGLTVSGPSIDAGVWTELAGSPTEADGIGRRRTVPEAIAALAFATIGAPAGVALSPPSPGRRAHFLLGDLPTLADYGVG